MKNTLQEIVSKAQSINIKPEKAFIPLAINEVTNALDENRIRFKDNDSKLELMRLLILFTHIGIDEGFIKIERITSKAM